MTPYMKSAKKSFARLSNFYICAFIALRCADGTYAKAGEEKEPHEISLVSQGKMTMETPLTK